MANNKSKNKELVNYKKTWADSILDNPIACVVAGLVAIVFGAFFIFLQSDINRLRKQKQRHIQAALKNIVQAADIARYILRTVQYLTFTLIQKHRISVTK